MLMSLSQVFSTGLSLFGYYALLAVGFSLIFATLRIFHIAHAAVFMSSGYVFFMFHRVLEINVLLSSLLSIACAATVGLAIDKFVYRAVLNRGGGMFGVFIASLGVVLIFEAGFLAWTKGVVSVARAEMHHIIDVAGVVVRAYDLIVFAIVAVVFALLYIWLHRTSTGLEVRGLTDNADLAEAIGVDVRITRTSIFLVASCLAGLAGILVAYDIGLEPASGFKLLFVSIVAVILGGLRNILLGAIVGAGCLGLLTAFAGFFFPEWLSFAIFSVMILLIIVRPQGILG